MPESVRSKLSDLVRGRAPEAKNTSVNYEIGQGWLKKKKKMLAAPGPNAPHTSETFLPCSWTFKTQGSPPQNLCSKDKHWEFSWRPRPCMSSEPLPMLFLQLGIAYDPYLSSLCAWLGPPTLGAVPAILQLVCVPVKWRSSKGRDCSLSPTSLWSFIQCLVQSRHWEYVLNEYF